MDEEVDDGVAHQCHTINSCINLCRHKIRDSISLALINALDEEVDGKTGKWDSLMFNKMKKLVFSFCLVLMPLFVFAATPLSYENEALGVKINAPQGWFITSGDKVQQTLNKGLDEITSLESIKEAIKKVGILVMFSQYEFGSPIEYNPNVALITEPLPSSYIKDVNDYANASLMNIKTMFKDVKIISEPKLVKLSGKDASHFIYEGSMIRGYLEIRIKSSVYLMLKDQLGYTLTCSDKVGNFDNNKEKFEAAVNSFILK